MWRSVSRALVGVVPVLFLAACPQPAPVEPGPLEPGPVEPGPVEPEPEVPGAPKVVILSPAEGEMLSAEPLTITFRVEEGAAPIVKLEATVGDVAWQPVYQREDGIWVLEADTPAYDNVSVTARVRAVDAEERETVAERDFRADTRKPRCELIDPRNGIVGGATPTALLRFEAIDGSGIASGRVSVDDGQTWVDGTVVGEELHYAWPVPEDAFFRTNVLSEVKDPYGHTCTWSHDVQVDTRPPQLTLVAPVVTGSPVRAGGPQQTELEVRVTVQDDDALAFVTVELDFDDGQGPRTMEGRAELRTLTVPLPLSDHVLHHAVIVAEDSFGNITRLPLDVLVDRVPPVFGNLTPAPGAKLNAADLGGQLSVMASWTVADGDPNLSRSTATMAGQWTTLTTDELAVMVAPNANGRAYDVFLRAEDSFGNRSEVQTHFTVDVVPPQVVQWSHPNNARMQPRTFSLEFSEPVFLPNGSSASSAIHVTPPPPGGAGTWIGNGYVLPGLQGDTVYTLNVAAGALVDGHGNPMAAISRSFHTEPVVPASGATLLTGVQRFEAASDEDGVVTLVVARSGSPQNRFRPYALDPVLGVPVPLAQEIQAGSSGRLHVTASRALNGLAADRVAGWSLQMTSGGSAGSLGGWYSATNGSYHTLGDELLVPVDRGCADMPTAGRVGFVSKVSGIYSRANSAAQSSGLSAAHKVGPASENLWALVGLAGTPTQHSLRMTARSCVCSQGTSSCTFDDVVELGATDGDLDRVSIAAAPMRILTVFPSGTAMRESCYGVTWPGCTSGLCAQPSVTSGLHPVGTELVVAPKFEGNRVLGARRVGAGSVELMQKDLSASCGAPWAALGTVPQSATATRFRPVRLGTRSAVLYLDGDALKVWYP